MKIKMTWLATEQSVAPTVTSKWATGYGGPSNGSEWLNMAIECDVKIYENHRQDGRYNEKTICPTVVAKYGTGGGNVPLVLMDAYQHHGYREGETCGTLTAGQNQGVRGDTPLVLMDQGDNRMDIRDDAVGTLRALGHVPLVLMDQGGGVMNIEHDKVGTLRAQTHGHEPLVLSVYENQRAEVRLSDKMNSITNPGGKPGQGNPVVLQEAYRISSDASNCMRSGNPLSGINKADISPTIDTIDPSPSKAQGGLAIVSQPPHCFKIRSGCEGGGKGYLGQDDKSFTLATNNDQYLMTKEPIPINTQAIASRSGDVTNRVGLGVGKEGEPSNTLGANHCHGVFDMQARVRKLTPRECERLQGFPDDYTKIPYRNKSAEDCPDSPRYKAIGNSWAVPCVRWIGERIQQQLNK